MNYVISVIRVSIRESLNYHSDRIRWLEHDVLLQENDLIIFDEQSTMDFRNEC